MMIYVHFVQRLSSTLTPPHKPLLCGVLFIPYLCTILTKITNASKKMKHSELINNCLFFLSLNRIFAWQNNTGAAKIGNAFVQFGKKGSSDIIGILPDGRFLGVEIKIGKDKQKPEQVIFQERIERNGGVYILVYSINDLIRHDAIVPFITCDIDDALRRMGLPPVAK